MSGFVRPASGCPTLFFFRCAISEPHKKEVTLIQTSLNRVNGAEGEDRATRFSICRSGDVGGENAALASAVLFGDG
jgi:hypothetical protein